MTSFDMSRPITRTRLHEQIARTLCLKIFDGELQPDSLLPNELNLAQQFGVSKPVIREAINFLEAKGLVHVRPRVGTRICDPSNWVLNDPILLKWRMEESPGKKLVSNLLEVRTIIEPIATDLAAQRATTEDIEKIFCALQAMEAAEDIESHIKADIDFHLALIEACGNDLLVSSLRPVVIHILDSSFRQFIHSFTAAQESVPVHRAVAEAIKDRDSEKAVNAMRKLISRSAADIETSEHLK